MVCSLSQYYVGYLFHLLTFQPLECVQEAKVDLATVHSHIVSTYTFLHIHLLCMLMGAFYLIVDPLGERYSARLGRSDWVRRSSDVLFGKAGTTSDSGSTYPLAVPLVQTQLWGVRSSGGWCCVCERRYVHWRVRFMVSMLVTNEILEDIILLSRFPYDPYVERMILHLSVITSSLDFLHWSYNLIEGFTSTLHTGCFTIKRSSAVMVNGKHLHLKQKNSVDYHA